MKKFKSTLLAGIILIGLLAFAACGGNEDASVIRIGATAVPHSEILEQVVSVLADKGFTLEIVVFDDFITPNMALDAGDIDLNYFQHVPFLNNFNDNHGTDLVPVFGVHFEPLRLYAGMLDSLEAIPQGAIVAIPDDPTNEARALQLLEALGLIKLHPDAGLSATALAGIMENPYNLTIRTLTAQTLPQILPDVHFAVINGNIALQGGVIDKAIYGAGETIDSAAAKQFTNYIVARAGDENNEGVRALIEAISTQDIIDFIYNQYHGRVVPVF